MRFDVNKQAKNNNLEVKPNRAGRPKGSLNKTTAAIKTMVETALTQAGGVDYLVRQADEQPVAFMGLVGKVLPMQVDATHSGEIVAQVVFRGLNG